MTSLTVWQIALQALDCVQFLARPVKDHGLSAGAPFQWAALFHKKSVRFLKGADSLTFLNSSDMSLEHILPCKVSCSRCRSPMADEGRNMWMSFPTLFKFNKHVVPEAFKPTDHIFYQQRCMDIKDGKRKWSKHQGESEVVED